MILLSFNLHCKVQKKNRKKNAIVSIVMSQRQSLRHIVNYYVIVSIGGDKRKIPIDV